MPEDLYEKFGSEELEIESFVDTKESRGVPTKNWFLAKIFAVVILLLVPISLIVFDYLQNPPTAFPTNTALVITPGTSVREAVTQLKDGGFIRSEIALYLELVLNHKDKFIKAGTYTFNEPIEVALVAIKLTEGDTKEDLLKLTLIEGESAHDIARRAEAILPDFDSDVFLTLALPHEGSLFPETYFLPKHFTAEDLFVLLTETFDERILTIEESILAHPLTKEGVIILASILEREANTLPSMKMVSGILQNRLAIGMALQVDASMEYILDKPLSKLTPEDLELDSPYNTYLYPGLPPTPIGNPGFEAISAVLDPEESEYLFYITGSDGNFYYAENFDQHRVNIARHLR